MDYRETMKRVRRSLEGAVPSYDRLIVFVLLVGVVLRVAYYLSNASLSGDEAMISLHVLQSQVHQLFSPEANFSNKTSPFGFLVLLKASTLLLGGGELALRLPSLLFGIASLFIFSSVARELLPGPREVLISVGLFSFLEPLVWHSAEVKHYSLDVFLALLILVTAVRVLRRKDSLLSHIGLAAVGIGAVWFSHPSVFMLAGAGTTLVVAGMARRDAGFTLKVFASSALWLTSFLICYYLYTSRLMDRADLVYLWGKGFMPRPIYSFAAARWLLGSFFGLFDTVAEFGLPGIAALSFVIGCVAGFRRGGTITFMLLAPLLFTLAAAALHVYPFTGRVLVFYLPAIIMLVSIGAGEVLDGMGGSRRYAAYMFIIFLFLMPVLSSTYRLVRPVSHEEIREVLGYIQSHRKEDDRIYVYYASVDQFLYYSKRLGLENVRWVRGISSRDDWNGYFEDLDGLKRQGRIWFVFSHVCNWKGVDEEKLFLFHLDGIGTRQDEVKSSGASAYLYLLE
jgi:hypothetical protein